ncbi:MAG TPA: FAD:protein FMN transferase [Candidatus Bipolaricaulota bacterium]
MRVRRFHKLVAAATGGVALALVLVAWWRPQTLERERILMGTFVQVKAYGGNERELNAAVEAAFREMQRLEGVLRRRGDGELGQLNGAPAGQAVAVSAELFDVLQYAERYRLLSRGAFDVTLGALEDLWGFVEDWDGLGRVPSPAEIDAWLAAPRGLELDEASKRVKRLSDATQIDLGGIAKGYAVDRALEVLRAHGVQAALVNAGGNVRTFGQVPEPFAFWIRLRPFQVAVQHPRQASKILGGISLEEGQGVATSGDYQRYFEVAGARYHHLFDPRTGQPARRLTSATVTAPTAMEADILSTAVFVLGMEAGLALAEQLPAVEAVLVTAEGQVLTSSGLDSTGFSL